MRTWARGQRSWQPFTSCTGEIGSKLHAARRFRHCSSRGGQRAPSRARSQAAVAHEGSLSQHLPPRARSVPAPPSRRRAPDGAEGETEQNGPSHALPFRTQRRHAPRKRPGKRSGPVDGAREAGRGGATCRINRLLLRTWGRWELNVCLCALSPKKLETLPFGGRPYRSPGMGRQETGAWQEHRTPW